MEPTSENSTSLTFGTWHLRGEELKLAVQQAYRLGFRHFDSAQLYLNEQDLADALPEDAYPSCTFTTKIRTRQYKKTEQIVSWVEERVKIFGDRLTTVLLHRPMLRYAYWEALEQCVEKGWISVIGVSNFTKYHIMEIMQNPNVKIVPQINQIEYHPFYHDDEVVEFCNQNSIRVDAHTVLGRGELIGHGINIARAYGVSPAEVLLAFVRQSIGSSGIPIVMSTSVCHLNELLHAEKELVLSQDEMNSLREHAANPIQYIKTENPIELVRVMDSENYVSRIVEDLKEDMKHPEELKGAANLAPVYRKTSKPQAMQVALLLYPRNDQETEEAWITRAKAHYRRLIPAHRRAYTEQQRLIKEAHDAEVAKTGKHKCCCIDKKWMAPDGSIASEAVTTPTPMPVAIPDHYELEPMFEFLKQQQTTTKYPIRFRKGSMFTDGRMDMCKQVVGPYMNELCDSVKAAEVDGMGGVQHFLLGNNIAFYDQSRRELGQDALADLMRSTKTIETWYMAGNYIDETMCEKMYHALKESEIVHHVWLKRNPVGPGGARHIGKLIGENTNIITLDLHNTGLMDEGCATFVEGWLETKTDNIGLRHLYLDANGISVVGARALVPLITAAKDTLESLFISLNPLKDEGAVVIIEALRGSRSLKRISFSSGMLTVKSLEKICSVIGSGELPSLISCDMGFYKSTYDMGIAPNLFVDTKATKQMPDPEGYDKLVNALQLLPQNGSLQYFSMEKSGLGENQAENCIKLLKDLGISNVNCKQWHWSRTFDYEMNPFDLRRVRQPVEVDHIESIYRNKM